MELPTGAQAAAAPLLETGFGVAVIATVNSGGVPLVTIVEVGTGLIVAVWAVWLVLVEDC